MDCPESYNLRPEPDGALHWEYDVPLRKNKRMISIYLSVIAIVMAILLLVFGLACRSLAEFCMIISQLWWIFAIIIGIFVISWLLCLPVYGSSFHMIYELHQDGVLAMQGKAEAGKTEILRIMTAAAGVASGKPRSHRNILSGFRPYQFVFYSEISSMELRPEADLILLKGPLTICDLYVSEKDFRQVSSELSLRCKKLTDNA